MITQKAYKALQLQYDVVIPPYNALSIGRLTSNQVKNWGHNYLKTDSVYSKTKGEKAVIAILDTAGSFADHPDLKANSLEQYAKNFSNAATLRDIHGHGTHCAGIAAAVDNSIGIIGVAPKAKLIPLKVLNDSGAGSYTWIANGLRYFADLNIEGKKIASLSLGGRSGSTLLHNAIKYAISKGVVIVAAAGNSYRAGQDTVGYPAKYPESIAVASLDNNGQPSSFSSAGPAVDVAAPGRGIFSTHKNGTYAYLSGTSMATPFISGVVALVLSQKDIAAEQVEAFLKDNATDIYTPGFDQRTGEGVPFVPDLINADPPEPTPEPEPEPPAPDPEPDPTPTPPSRDERAHVLDMPDTFSVFWKRLSDNSSKRMNFTTKVLYAHRKDFEQAVRFAKEKTTEYLTRRGFVISDKQDAADIPFWIAFFFKMHFDRQDIDLEITEITATIEGVKFTVSDFETRPTMRKATINGGITYQF